MEAKLTVVLCLMVYMTKALPLDDAAQKTLEKLGLGYKDQYDYNQFILGLETVVEAAQKGVIDTIEKTVNIAEEFTRIVKSLGVQQNMQEINDIQTEYFQRIEDMRHQAYDQKVDISKCAFNAVHQLNIESQKSINNITNILVNITNTFSNFSQVRYTDPANQNMQKTYSVRERIYKCPFSFTDFTPFYVCLTTTAVLQDIIILNDFTASLNDTIKDIEDLAYEFNDAATQFKTQNVEVYNFTASNVYSNELLPCAVEQGLVMATL